MKLNIILFSILAIIAATSDAQYCAKFCKDYATQRNIPHIACGHNGKFRNSCPANAKLVTITNPLKNLILNAHNAKRNLIAGGGNRRHSPACRMATMEWDDELASLAALNVKQCKMAHDHCHPTKKFEFSGQNLARTWQSPAGMGLSNSKLLMQSISGWYKEVKYSRQSYINSYPQNYQGPAIGHFTVMMADRNNRVGCAAATYTKNNRDYFLFACNYATNNMIGFPIYAKCRKAASSCSTGVNRKYHNLCSKREKYNINKWY